MVNRYRRRRRTRRVGTKLNKAVKAIVKRQIETKASTLVIDNILGNGTGIAINTTPFYVPVLDEMSLRQGTSSNEYIGAQIRLQYLKCRGAVLQADVSNVIRVMLIRARANFKFSTGDREPFLTQDYPLFSDTNPKYVAQVLYDRVFVLNAASDNNNQLKYLRKNFNLKNQLIRVIQEDVYTSELYWVLVSDSAVAPSPGFLMNMTLTWKDG